MGFEMKNEILVAIGRVEQNVIDIVQNELKEIKKQTEKIPEMQTDIKNLNQKVEKIEYTIPEVQSDIRNISRSVAVIEQEHGDKLKALFDAFSVNTEREEAQSKKNNFFERKLEKHDEEIYQLNTKVQGL